MSCFSVLINLKFFIAILPMSKNKVISVSAKGTHNISRVSFDLEWVKVKVTADTPHFKKCGR